MLMREGEQIEIKLEEYLSRPEELINSWETPQPV